MLTALPPGPNDPPIAGSLPRFRRERATFLMDMRQTYGTFVHFRLSVRHGFLLNEPADIREVLVEQADKFYKTPLFKKNAHRTIGSGLLTSEDDLHKRQRRLVQPAFHHHRIASYGETMVRQTLGMLAAWQDGETRDLQHDMTALTLGIVSRTLFGADVSGAAEAVCDAITNGLHHVMQRTMNPLALPDWIPTPGNARARRSAALLDDVVMGMIEERRKFGEDRGDLLSMLLLAVDEEGSGGMSDRQARDEAMTLFIAGHETTANALTWTLMLLAQHPAVMETLRAEVDSVLGGRAATVQDLAALPYTEMVVKESMRLYPPAWVIGRLAVKELTVGDYRIPRGSIVLISPYVLHRDPRFFPEPERFMPERFAPEIESRIPRYAYLPFGAGPRVCIGNNFAMMEARLILATLVQHYQFALAPGQIITPEPLITLRPKHGLPMRVTRRERSTGELAGAAD